jgi:hypothetical protein
MAGAARVGLGAAYSLGSVVLSVGALFAGLLSCAGCSA